jgi:hypothetical protein
MAENHRSPRTDVVDVTAIVLIEYAGAGCALDENRLSADAAKSSDGRIHAAGNVAAGIGK